MSHSLQNSDFSRFHVPSLNFSPIYLLYLNKWLREGCILFKIQPLFTKTSFQWSGVITSITSTDCMITYSSSYLPDRIYFVDTLTTQKMAKIHDSPIYWGADTNHAIISDLPNTQALKDFLDPPSHS